MTLLEGEALLIRRRVAHIASERTWSAWLIFKNNPVSCYDHWKSCGMMEFLDALKVPR